jgi:hypothetical protein
MMAWTPGDQTISVARLNGQQGGPGRSFRLTEASIANSLRAAAEGMPAVEVISAVGLPQLIVRAEKRTLVAQLLEDLYDRRPDEDVVDQLVGGEPIMTTENAAVAP